ncbi:hypothetical protein GCM10023089_08200 [Quisquiliibacterium transsilvanicum]
MLACAAVWLPAWGQPRTFDEATRLGTLEVTVFPQARLDGKEILLAPGARIRNESNLLAVPSTLRGNVPVRYRTDPMGQVLDAWILTSEELQIAKDEARRRPSTR